ncbi:MAG: AAA family ATPase, partial [Chloroflexota bacterium]
ETNSITDLYAVGVLLYQLLTGRHPFEPFDYRFYMRLVGEDVDLEGVPDPFKPILAKSLAKEPSHRYQQASELLADLAAVLGRESSVETHEIRESYLQAAGFVGREREVVELALALRAASDGAGSAWLIGGESGVGKSRLTREIKTRGLVAGFQLLSGQAIRDGGGAPYQLWVEPLRQLLVTQPLIDDLTAGVLLSIVPDISRLLARDIAPAPELEGESAQNRLFDAILNLFQHAERPILLVLEDLQWARESLLPLSFLTRAAGHSRLMIVGNFRNDERLDLPDLLPEMRYMPLARLSQEEMAELSHAMLGEIGRREEILTYIQDESEGNAFFAVEIVRVLAEEAGRLQSIGDLPLPETLLPDGIQAIVQRQIDKIPPEGRPLLELAAVAGREIDPHLLDSVTDPQTNIDWWLQVCADCGLIEVDQNRWRFSHDKLREGVLIKLSKADRQTLHDQIANGLEALYGGTPIYYATLFFHWGEASVKQKERQYAILAGDFANEQFNYQDSLAFYERAHQLMLTAETAAEQRESVDLINKLSNALVQSDTKRAYALASEAYQLASNQHLLEQPYQFGIATSMFKMGEAKSILGENTAAKAFYEEAVRAFDMLGDKQRQTEAMCKLGSIYRTLNELGDAEEMLQTAKEIATEIGDLNLIAELDLTLAILYSAMGRWETAHAHERMVLENARKLGNRKLEAHTLLNLGTSLGQLEEHQQAAVAIEKAIELASAMNLFHMLLFAKCELGSAYTDLGEYDKAWALFEENLIDLEGKGYFELDAINLIRILILLHKMDAFEKAVYFARQAEKIVSKIDWVAVRDDLFEVIIKTYEEVGMQEKVDAIKLRALDPQI